MVRRLRSAVVTLALVGLAGALCAMYVLGRVDEEIRAEVERRFRAHYPSLSVSVRSARWFEGQGIRIRGISIVEPTGDVRQAELAYVEELFAVSNAKLQNVVLADIPVQQVVFRGLTVRSTRQADGSWSGWRLWPPPSFSATPPNVRFENGRLECVDPRRPEAAPLVLRDVNLDATPHHQPGATASATTTGQVSAADAPVAFAVRGSFASDHFRRAAIDASFSEGDGQWSCTGSVENFQLSPELWQAAPPAWTQQLPPGLSVRGRANLRFEAGSDPQAGAAPRFVVAGDFSDVRVSHPRLPYPIADFQGTAYLDNRQLKIENAEARCGPALVRLAYRREGLTVAARQSLSLDSRELPLDLKLVKAIPGGPRLWEMLQPAGTVDAHATLAFDGQTWRTDAAIDLIDVSFAYEDFPYRLHGGTGRVELHGDELSFHMRARASGQDVRLDGRLHDPGPATTGWLEIASQGPAPLNDQLLAALDEDDRRVVADFAPRGAATVWGRIERTDPRAARFDKHFLVRLHNCAIKHAKFPYPIDSVQGVLEHRDGRWEFRDLEGWKGGAHISCHGEWRPTAEGSELRLYFEANQVPLDDDLRFALSPAAQNLWGELHPRGVVDQLKAEVGFALPARRLTLDVQATKWPNQPQTVERRPISIVPTWFPYRLDNLTGTVHFRDGEIELRNLHAAHEAARLSAAGRVSTTEGGGPWRFRLERLTADRLHYDRALAEALPPGLAGAAARLAPTGPLSLYGWLEFAGSGRPGDKPTSRWDLTCETVGGSLKAGAVLENVYGGVRMVGQCDGERFASRGQIDLDSLFCKGVQLVRVQGPIYLDNARVLVGGWAPAEEGQPPRRLTAQTLGGVLQGDARCALAGEGEFALQATLLNGDLKTIARETTGQNRRLSGTVLGMVRLSGAGHGYHTWRGDGLVRLREADVYQLPVMVSLLKVLRLQPPDATAFTTSNIDFQIQGEHLYFNRIDFTGDAVSLWGTGEMSLERQLNLKLFVQVGRSDSPIPLVGNLVSQVFREAGRNLLLIHVNGPLENPDLRPETFPGLNEMFEEMFPEEARAHARASSSRR